MFRPDPEQRLLVHPRHARSPSWLACVAASGIIALTSAAWHVPAWAQPAVRSSVAAGVTVNVMPGPFTASEWSFKVVFDTHTQNLDDDLAKTAVLLVDGVELHPALWSAPGSGHHREGVLTFSAPTHRPGNIELRITRPNEPEPRVFRWEGGALP